MEIQNKEIRCVRMNTVLIPRRPEAGHGVEVSITVVDTVVEEAGGHPLLATTLRVIHAVVGTAQVRPHILPFQHAHGPVHFIHALTEGALFKC
jgi:hypothetical protein